MKKGFIWFKLAILIVLSIVATYSFTAAYDQAIHPRATVIVVENSEKNDAITILDVPKVSDIIASKPVEKEEVKEVVPEKKEETKTTTSKSTTSNASKSTTKSSTSKSTTKSTTTTKKATSNQEKFNLGKISIDSVFSKDIIMDDGTYYYLNHDLNGKYNGVGMPIIDSRTNFQTTRKVILYGHSSNARNGSSPFDYFHHYYTYGNNNGKAFYQKHPYITIQYEGHTYKYQIFSVYVSTASPEEKELSQGLEYFRVMNYAEAKWDEIIKWYKSNSQYETGVNVSNEDRILIIQTCATYKEYSNKNIYYRANLLVMAKLVSVD